MLNHYEPFLYLVASLWILAVLLLGLGVRQQHHLPLRQCPRSTRLGTATLHLGNKTKCQRMVDG